MYKLSLNTCFLHVTLIKQSLIPKTKIYFRTVFSVHTPWRTSIIIYLIYPSLEYKPHKNGILCFNSLLYSQSLGLYLAHNKRSGKGYWVEIILLAPRSYMSLRCLIYSERLKPSDSMEDGQDPEWSQMEGFRGGPRTTISWVLCSLKASLLAALLHEVFHWTQRVPDITDMTQPCEVTFVLISSPLMMAWRALHLYTTPASSHAFQMNGYINEWTNKWHFCEATFVPIAAIDVNSPGFATRLHETTSQFHGVVVVGTLNPCLRNIMNSSTFKNKL